MNDTSPHSFEGHLQRGDLHAAADWLVRAHGRDVLHLCTAIVRDRGTAEDLAQDAFGKAFQALPEFRGDASARTWLLTIARHRCLDHLRRSARQPWSLGREDDVREPRVADTEEVLVSDLMARRADIRDGLAVLSESERAMVLLRFAHGLSFDEIAESFGVKSGAVRMRVGRALTKMRDAIAGTEEFTLEERRSSPSFARARPVSPAPAAGGAPLPAPNVAPAAPAPAPSPGYMAPPAPPPMAAAPPPMGAAPRARSSGVFAGLTKIVDGLRATSSGEAPSEPSFRTELRSALAGVAPPPTSGHASLPTSDPSLTLGEVLWAVETAANAAADHAFLARLGRLLPGTP